MQISSGAYSLASLRQSAPALHASALGKVPCSSCESPAEKLVAGSTNASIDFADLGSAPRRSVELAGGSFALYTRAAEKNAVATAVVVGRSLDVQG